jgi:preprotein translocase subunit SecA
LSSAHAQCRFSLFWYLFSSQQIAEQAYPTIKYVYENKGNMYTNIIVPITDGVKQYNVVVNLEKAYQTKGEEIVHAYDKTAVLRNIDESWKEHLREMDDLRQSVRAASYEQKDPLLIYKLESYNIFKEMLDKTNRSIISILMKAYIPMSNPDEVKEAHQPRQRLDTSRMRTGREEIGGNVTHAARSEVRADHELLALGFLHIPDGHDEVESPALVQAQLGDIEVLI